MAITQKTFNGVDTFFQWVQQDDGSWWYTWEPKAARKAALRERNAEARRLEKAGHRVSKFSLGEQLRSRGGIGSGRPHIEFVCTTYGLNILS